MADNVTLNAGSGGDTIAADDDGTAKHQYVKLEAGADNTQTKIEAGGGTEATALRVTIASDSTGVLSVDDNGGALTVDGTVTANLSATDNAVLDNIDADTSAIQTATEAIQTAVEGTLTVDSELTTADLDTGAGTDTRAVVGLVGSASGGGALIPGSATDGLLVNLGANNDVTVSGVSTAANQTTIIGHVDGIEALLTTIDADTSTLAAAVSTEMQVDVVGALPAGTNNIGDVDIASIAAGDNNIGNVDIASIAAGDNNIGNVDIVSGTITTVSTLTGGGVAHDGADSGNPVKVGGRGISSNITALTANDRTDQLTDLLGYQLVRPYALNQNTWSDSAGPITDTTSTEVEAAPAAGVRLHVTSLLVTNSDATVGTNVQITDGNAGTVLWEGYAAAAGGGFSCTFPTPLRLTAATALHAVCGTTSAEVRVSAAGFSEIS